MTSYDLEKTKQRSFTLSSIYQHGYINIKHIYIHGPVGKVVQLQITSSYKHGYTKVFDGPGVKSNEIQPTIDVKNVICLYAIVMFQS